MPVEELIILNISWHIVMGRDQYSGDPAQAWPYLGSIWVVKIGYESGGPHRCFITTTMGADLLLGGPYYHPWINIFHVVHSASWRNLSLMVKKSMPFFSACHQWINSVMKFPYINGYCWTSMTNDFPCSFGHIATLGSFHKFVVPFAITHTVDTCGKSDS